jgi:hypothetical protein
LKNIAELEKIYNHLFAYCATEGFAGYDPFDALNSRIFQALPLKKLALARLGFLQTVKRSPLNLRPFLKIEKGVNPKALALFALAELARFRAGFQAVHAENAKQFLAKLLELKITIPNPKSQISNRAAFGYNFDWQSRAFFAPEGTPTVVPTAFATQALLEGYRLFNEEIYLETAREVCAFITEDLNLSGEAADEICFSYTPLDKSVIFNASLLAAECLAGVGAISGDENYLELAEKSARFVIRRQKENGAWTYGSRRRHRWVDNFHTAYILLSLFRLQKLIPNLQSEAEKPLRTGLEFWLENFFLPDGAPKYYDRRTFPIDIHSASAAIIALCELRDLDAGCLPLAEKVAHWTVENMRDADGFFYYQKRRFYTVKVPFMRWANAWMAYAIARLLESNQFQVPSFKFQEKS